MQAKFEDDFLHCTAKGKGDLPYVPLHSVGKESLRQRKLFGFVMLHKAWTMPTIIKA